MNIYALRRFARRARRLSVDDADLMAAVARIERGSVDAHLGSSLIKQRVPRPGHGKSRSARTVLFCRHGDMVVFLHIFIKSEQADLAPRELEGMRGLAQEISALGYPDIEMLLELGEWSHVG